VVGGAALASGDEELAELLAETVAAQVESSAKKWRRH